MLSCHKIHDLCIQQIIMETSLVAQMVKASAYNVRDPGLIPGKGRSLGKEMATHSSTLAWKIP